MAMLINYKYDKDHDYIVKSEISQNENQLDNNRKVVIYDRPLLNVLREAILTDRSDYSALNEINPILKRNNAKKAVDSKYKLMKYELMTIYQNLLAEQLLGLDTYDGSELDLPLDLEGLGRGDFETWERPLSNLFNQLSYKETLEVANRLVKYLKERENWNIEDIVTEDGIMELFRGKNHPLV